MLCQKCGKNEANAHFEQIVNGSKSNLFLCDKCAALLGFDSLFSNQNFNLNSVIAGMLGISRPEQVMSSDACPVCGAGFNFIVSNGKVGCANCYEHFYDKLLPSIQRIHGTIQHTGKLPDSAGVKLKERRQLSELKSQLDDAIALQEFEKAAELRDKIRMIEGNDQIK